MFDDLISIPAFLIRGGTSKGVYLLEDDLPADRSLWAPLLLAMFGSGDPKQIDGIGSAEPWTSKCCIIGRGCESGIDITYTFAQVGIGQKTVYWDINCGNLTGAVGMFAMAVGLVPLREPKTHISVYQTNTRSIVRIGVPYMAGGIPTEGPLKVSGVPGTGMPIDIDFSGTVGASLGRGLFPTGRRRDRIVVDGVGEIECSIVDLANMCVFVRAADIRYTGIEPPEQGPAMAETFFSLKRAAQSLLGMDHGRLTPWPVIVAPPKSFTAHGGGAIAASDYDVAVRVVSASSPVMHKAFMGTGASCTATAAMIPGTIVHEAFMQSRRMGSRPGLVRLAHPSGVMEIQTGIVADEAVEDVREVIFQRTARPIMEGKLYVSRAKLAALTEELGADHPARTTVPSSRREAADVEQAT